MDVPAVKIAPSLLSADFVNLARDVAAVEAAGADWLHVDVMDGHFVPNLTIGLPVVKALKRVAQRPLDVHIMIANPDEYATRYVEAGADVLTAHLETFSSGSGSGSSGGSGESGQSGGSVEGLRAIRAAGAKAAISVNPETDVAPVRELLDEVDMVLIMSVHPGFGGQSFMPEVLPKIEALRSWGFAGDIEIDGGIAPDTIGDAAAAGANVFVSGSGVFKSDDWAATIATMRATAEERLAAAGLQASV